MSRDRWTDDHGETIAPVRRGLTSGGPRNAPQHSTSRGFSVALPLRRRSMKRESSTGGQRLRILLLVLAIAAVLGCFAITAGCTTSSTTTSTADSGTGRVSTTSPDGVASGTNVSGAERPADPPRDRPNGAPPGGEFQGSMVPNGTPPAGAPPGDRNVTGGPPGGAPPEGMWRNGTPPADRVGSPS